MGPPLLPNLLPPPFFQKITIIIIKEVSAVAAATSRKDGGASADILITPKIRHKLLRLKVLPPSGADGPVLLLRCCVI